MKKALWINPKRMYRGQQCIGGYKTFSGKRMFILVDQVKGQRHRFDSHEAAKSLGWVRK